MLAPVCPHCCPHCSQAARHFPAALAVAWPRKTPRSPTVGGGGATGRNWRLPGAVLQAQRNPRYSCQSSTQHWKVEFQEKSSQRQEKILQKCKMFSNPSYSDVSHPSPLCGVLGLESDTRFDSVSVAPICVTLSKLNGLSLAQVPYLYNSDNTNSNHIELLHEFTQTDTQSKWYLVQTRHIFCTDTVCLGNRNPFPKHL